MRGALLEHRDYDHLPYAYMRVHHPDALVRILEDPAVVAVYEIRAVKPSTAESLPAIHQPESVRYDAFQGQGTAVVVLDTGVNFTQPEFNSCTAVGVPAGCRVVFAQDFAPNDNALDDHGHGTNVAAIVAQTAPGTDIIALDVFRFVDCNGDGIPDCHQAFSPDIMAAINWVIANQAQFNIVAMNLSLGGPDIHGNGYTPATCPGDFTTAFQNTRAAGVWPIAAAGNEGFANALDWPACEPDAIAVGAVYDGNLDFDVPYLVPPYTDSAPQTQYQVTCFSNSHPAVAILAPGAKISAGGIEMYGTSQAAPHVAGATAIVSAVNPNLQSNAVHTALLVSQTFSTDAKSGVTTPVLDLRASVLDASPHTAAVEAVMDEYYSTVNMTQLLDAVGYMHEVNNLTAVRSRALAPLVLIAIGPLL
jgi:subtilisin family serine protease